MIKSAEIQQPYQLGHGGRLNLLIYNDIVSTKMYDKRDDFNFDIVNFPFLDGDVPRRPSYGLPEHLHMLLTSIIITNFNCQTS